jgi:hypothetical protein
MSTQFQPDHPHEPTRTASPGRAVVVFSLIGALAAMLIAATFMPRVSHDQTLNWIVTIGLGVLVLALGLLYGATRARHDNPPA